MRRRSFIKTVPLSLAGLAALPELSFSSQACPLGLQYMKLIRERLEKIRATQSDEMLEASYHMANAIKSGKKACFLWDIGHSTNYDLWPGRPGFPDFLIKGIPGNPGKGDVILANCWDDNLKSYHDKGAFLIGGGRPWGGDNIGCELLKPEVQAMKIKPFADMWIELYHTSYGAVLTIPGETAPMGPASGAVGMMTLWMMISDIARLLVADGKKFDVMGDEPELKKDAPTVNLNSPLANAYYETAMKQFDAIEKQFDTVEKIARMAVHATLTGGRVYVYSLDKENLCAEGTVRRGGLGLTFGVYGTADKMTLMDDPLQRGDRDPKFTPTDKDVVIMGIGMPDSPDDLAVLDMLKKTGAGVCAIGPCTRNGEIPNGRTIPKEVDIYIGDMMDTYGIFALPGIKKKISPTSGLMNTQIFWTVCAQIADQIYQRTGNAPGVFLSGALKGGMEKLNEVKRVYKERGY